MQSDIDDRGVFRAGRYYRHTTGMMLHIVGRGQTTMWGVTLFAEVAGTGEIRCVGRDENSARNWTECTEAEWMTAFHETEVLHDRR